MTQKRLKYYIVLIIVFLSWFDFVDASILFNEVQLSPTENRFIEIYNSGSQSVNLTDWYIQRKTATGDTFGSLVSKTNFEGVEIGAGEYLLISKTSINNSHIIIDGLTLTESNSVQIKNSNQEVVDSLEWGSIPDGKSTQRISGDWLISSPTPGVVNRESNSTNNDDEYDENEINEGSTKSSSTSSNSTSDKEEEKAIRKITAKILSPVIVFEGIPFKINSLVTTNKKETLAVGKFKWNFGDGSTKQDTSSNEFEHIYFYPGEYVLSLDYSERRSSTIDDSVRLVVKVIPREILISSVGDIKDPFIEIENKSNYEIVLSGWIITAGMHYFKIPDGTVLLANKKVKFSGRVTGFVLEDLNTITITNRNTEIMAFYPQIKNVVKKVSSKSATLVPKEITSIETEKEEDITGIDLNDLGASAVNSQESTPRNYAYWGLAGIIIIGMTSVLLFRRNKKEEIGYLEDDIRAEDIKIIE